MCLNETYSRDRQASIFSDIFPTKNGWNKMLYHNCFSTLLLAYAIRRVQVSPEGLKLNGIYQHLVYADDVNILDKSVHIIKKNTEALVVWRKVTGLEVNADKIKYMAMSWDQNAGQNHILGIDDKSFERVEQFQHFGTSTTNQNSNQEEITSKVKSGKCMLFSVQNLLSSSMLSKNIKTNNTQNYNSACCFVCVWN